jgi:predicted nucleic-acid-binding Zn-ribbon protein
MKNGRCPQCGSETVYSRPGGVGFGNIDKIFVNAGNSHNPSSFTALVCVTCGYLEIYLSDNYLADITKTWSKVQVKA